MPSPRARSVSRLPRLSRDDGAAAVEFALVVPVLVMLVFGIINYGVVFSQQLTLNNAVREGARGSVVQGTSLSCKGIRTAVGAALSGLAVNPASMTIKTSVAKASGTTTTPCGGDVWSKTTDTTATDAVVPCTGSADGDSVVVEARYTANLMAPLPPFPSTMNLTAKAVFRCEFS